MLRCLLVLACTLGFTPTIVSQIAPILTSPFTAPVVVLLGTGQPIGKDGFTAGTIKFCSATSSPTPNEMDCATPLTLTNGTFNAVPVDANGNFVASLSTALTTNTYVWAEQVTTNAAGSIKQFSTAVQLGTGGAAAPNASGDSVIITQPLREGVGIVSGTATASTSSSPNTVQLWVTYLGGDGTSSPYGTPIAVDTTGAYAINAMLHAGDTVRVKSKAGTFSTIVTVQPTVNQREHFDFVAGTVLSQGESNFSQADTFIALNADREWVRSHAVLCSDYANQKMLAGAPCSSRRRLGLNTYFQARLTSIPINSSSTTTTSTATSSGSSTSTPATPSLSSFLSSQKTGQFESGIYFPITVSPAAVVDGVVKQTFYVAPIFRFGFNALAMGASSTTVTTTPATDQTTTTTTTPTQLGAAAGTPLPSVYNFGAGGLRIGTAELQPGGMKNVHYLDLTVGKFSNLENLYCPSGPCSSTSTAGETRYRPYRLSFEGYLELPDTGFIVGMSANVGVGFFDKSGHTDTQNRAASDVRFLFAYRFDAAKLIQQLPTLK